MPKPANGTAAGTLAALAQQEPIPEEIEAEFLGRAVGDVTGVRLAPLRLRHLRLDDADRQSPSSW